MCEANETLEMNSRRKVFEITALEACLRRAPITIAMSVETGEKERGMRQFRVLVGFSLLSSARARWLECARACSLALESRSNDFLGLVRLVPLRIRLRPRNPLEWVLSLGLDLTCSLIWAHDFISGCKRLSF